MHQYAKLQPIHSMCQQENALKLPVSRSQNSAKMRKINRPWTTFNMLWTWSGYISMSCFIPFKLITIKIHFRNQVYLRCYHKRWSEKSKWKKMSKTANNIFGSVGLVHSSSKNQWSPALLNTQDKNKWYTTIHIFVVLITLLSAHKHVATLIHVLLYICS